MEITLDSQPRQNEDIAVQIVEGRAFLMDPHASELHALGGVGTRVYELIDGRRTVGDIIAVLLDEYDVDFETLKQDTLDFLAELVDRGLILVGE